MFSYRGYAAGGGRVTRFRGQRASSRARAAATASRTPPGPGAGRGAGCGRLEAAVADRRGDLLVRVAERHPALDERLGGVGREEQRVARRGREPLAVELQAANQRRQRGQRARQVARARAKTGVLSSCRSRL